MQLIPLLINFTSFAQLQIKDKLRTFPRREGFTRNKEKISCLICFDLLYPIPYAIPHLGRRVLGSVKVRSHIPIHSKTSAVIGSRFSFPSYSPNAMPAAAEAMM